MQSTPGLPFLFEEGMDVAFVPPLLDVPRDGVVDFAEPSGDYAGVIYVDSVEDVSTAEALVGSKILVRREQMPRIAEGMLDDSWSGWQLLDEEGVVVGDVLGVEQRSVQPLLSVAVSGKEAPALVPLVEELLLEVNEDEQSIVMRIPAGLLDL